MKSIILLLLVIISMQSQAACKCNCNPADASMCAISYDIDNPCPGLCPGKVAPNVIPMTTATIPLFRYYQNLPPR